MDKGAACCADQRDFLLRRLHSLTGLVPVGAYMVIHLLTNATVWKPLGGPAAFQRAVNQIHSLDKLLPFVEWTFIFLPILFHAIFGIVIIKGSQPNHSTYRYGSNFRYTLQRATGMIAFVFIAWHVFHMHGWVHSVAKPLGGAMFSPFNAASSLGEAMKSVGERAFYAVGVLSCVFHLANGIWTAGITWGVWTSVRAMDRALKACAGFGVLIGIVGLSALWGASTVNVDEALDVETRMSNSRLQAGEIDEETAEHKRSEKGKDAAKAIAPAKQTANKD